MSSSGHTTGECQHIEAACEDAGWISGHWTLDVDAGRGHWTWTHRQLFSPRLQPVYGMWNQTFSNVCGQPTIEESITEETLLNVETNMMECSECS